MRDDSPRGPGRIDLWTMELESTTPETQHEEQWDSKGELGLATSREIVLGRRQANRRGVYGWGLQGHR